MSRHPCVRVAALALATASAQAHAQDSATPTPNARSQKPTPVQEVVVTASRLNLLGLASTASQGSVTREEIELRPIYRVGELYESIPGLVVTVHSGESKANQYELRGFDLDHGTDFASFVDGMPINRGTNAHGQGYSDQNFLMPQIVQSLDYAKGPYYAATGDFGAVGSAHLHLSDTLPTQISASVGTLRTQELYAGGTRAFDNDDRLWGAIDYGHLNGPWDPPSDFRKIDAAARFSHGSDANGFSLTALYYLSSGGLETDQPLRAVQEGLIGRFGVLDPTDHGRSERFSVSGHYGVERETWSFAANAYAIHSTMTLINDFTHFLDDPVNGDQEQQDETRDVFGGDAALTLKWRFGAVAGDTTFGVQEREDRVYVDRRHTLKDIALDYCEVEGPFPPGVAIPTAPADAPAPSPEGQAVPVPAPRRACDADRVGLNDLGAYVETTTHWTPWLRTVVGLREEDFHADDHSLTTGFRGATSQTLFQPKGSLILGPWLQSELYFSGGRGFHSNDVRGVFGTVPIEGIPQLAGRTPLLAPATGEEVGIRTNLASNLALQLAVFREDFKSELAFDEDQGQDQATAPSRRRGVEVSGQYRPFPWVELSTDLAFARARYTASSVQLANFGLDGPYVGYAPAFIGSFGLLLDHLGPWYGGIQWRDLGSYPVSDGDKSPTDKGYQETNVDLGYRLNRRLKLQVSVFNLFDTKANASVFYYTSRLPGEPAAGVTDFQVHPLEPISGRLTVTATF